jgi:hypothetical protein
MTTRDGKKAFGERDITAQFLQATIKRAEEHFFVHLVLVNRICRLQWLCSGESTNMPIAHFHISGTLPISTPTF